MDESLREDIHGRQAQRPTDIPARGWLDVGWRTVKRFSDDNVTLIAGGLAMYALLSVFPALAALVSIYGMFATPRDVIEQMNTFAGVLPPGVWDIFNTELQSITKTDQGTLSIAVALGVVVALWSARSGMSSLMTATNIAYQEHERRGFVHTTLLSLGFTAGAIIGFILMLALGVAIPLVLAALGTSEWAKALVSTVRVALLWAVMVIGLAAVYRYAPARQHARWRWVSTGSVIAATLWLGASSLFAFYVTNFAGYAKTYGALGGVVVLLMWFYISSIVIVVGAQINAESERQTFSDTTDSRDAPLGHRGAFAADTVGPLMGSHKPATADENTPAPSQFTRSKRSRRAGQSENNAATAWNERARLASVAGSLLDKAAVAANPATPRLGRATATISAVRHGMRILPAVGRTFRQHPLSVSLVIGALLGYALSAGSAKRLK